MAVLALILLSGCQNNVENVMETTQSDSKVVVTASLDAKAESRTSLTEEEDDVFKVLWSADDKLGIFYYSAAAHNKFKLTNGAGESNAEFENDGPFKVVSGTESGNASYFACVGYYPYAENTTATKNADGSYTIKTAIAVNQTYAENSFGANNYPMVAISDNLNFSFKNAASVLRMPLKGDAKIVKVTLTSSAKKIAGPYSVTMTEANSVGDLSITDGGSSMIVLECEEPVQLKSNEATYFLFVIPPGTYAANDLTVKFYDDQNKFYSTIITENNEFVRSGVLTFSERTYENPQNVGVAEAKEELANGVENVEVIITDNDRNPTLELPATTSENPTNINFASLPVDALVTIQAGTESQGGEAKNVNLTVPANQTGYDFNIQLPNSTVTLNANEGQTATFDEVTAATADNTLIIGESVTVNTLKVKKGHVRVRGKVGEISYIGESGQVTYIICEGELLNDSDPSDNIVYISAAEYDLRKAIDTAKAGSTVTLESNIDLSESVVVNKDLIVNLNGKEIKCATSDVFVVTAGTLTIEGKGLVYGSEGNNGNSCAVWVNGANAKAIIKGGTYQVGGDVYGKDDKRNDCIYVGKEGGTIEIWGGEFKYTGDVKDGSINDGHRFLINQNNLHTTQLITVYGGTFYNFDPSNARTDEPWMTDGIGSFVAAGYSSVAGGNETYTVSKGILNEAALKAAIVAGQTEITLGADIDLASSVVISSGNLTINLNDKSIKCATSDVFVVEGGTLTIEGKGLVYGSEGNQGNSCAIWVNGANAKAIIKGGTYQVGGDVYGKDDKRNDCIYVGKEGGTIEIWGGEFKYTGDVKDGSINDGHRFLINQNNLHTTQLITVYGGTFYNFDPSNARTDEPWMTDGIGSFVAAGYSSVAGGNETYTVSKGILNEAALKAAIVAGQTEITLGTDIKLTSSVVINSGNNVVLNLNGHNIEATGCDAFKALGTLTINAKDENKISASGDGVCAVWACGGTVTINGGHYSVGADSEGNRNDCIYAGFNADGAKTLGTIIINGGKFEYTGPSSKEQNKDGDCFLLNCANSDSPDAHIIVNGGQFKNHVPSYEDYGKENEVALGDNKKVYYNGEEIEVAHSSGSGEKWYVVK